MCIGLHTLPPCLLFCGNYILHESEYDVHIFCVALDIIIYQAAAIQTVLKTYESYIRNKCIKTVYDERGLVYYGIDTDKKDFMERRLVHAVVENFKIDR